MKWLIIILPLLASCSALKPAPPIPVDTCGIQKQQNTIIVTQ